MTLTTRVSAFFLVMLAAALAVYSLAFYSVTSRQIHFQFEREMSGVLNALVAAAEVEDTEVKWQPLEHSIAFGSLDEFGEVEWIVIGDQQIMVESARSVDPAFQKEARELVASSVDRGALHIEASRSEPRLMMYRRLQAPHPQAIARELDEFDEVMVFVSRSTVKRDALLWRLTTLVILLPLAAWLIAAILGRWAVRQSLRPVSKMSEQAQMIAGTDFQTRLQVDDTGDELAELGLAFNRLLDRQQVAFEQQRRFAGDAAHELRSPITVLMGEIDVTLRRPRSETEYQGALEVLRKQTKTLQEIVESLLFLARSEGDATLPELQPIDLHSWLDNHFRSWANRPRGTDLQLQNHLEASTTVLGTNSLLAQIVENLVSNALKYSEPGTPVVVSAECVEEEVLIEVADSGYGISDADQEHLFDAFFRSSDARNRGIAGNGLGLAIASRIANALGGRLQCTSRLGQGSRFGLYLPVNARPEPADH
ncbi:sensor histidine kinase [Allorhodopirellula solitaria]|uniref:histidine kinase n=1 Tax=Allorhodopirellula solitaria TaxID=2527987 RepID=A0A5C5XQD7_9BACT|nr:ATP-binding protein [Allorhodopirellula solitaria]TWT65120.1 Sensor kinase CusS [Allorhodopirellula solitaria]